MKTDAVFRGCTRPAMLMGVPMIPFLGNGGFCTLLAMYFNLLWFGLFPLTHFILLEVTRRDDLIFQLIGVWAKTKLRCIGNPRMEDGSTILSPAKVGFKIK